MKKPITILALCTVFWGCYKESDYAPEKRQLEGVLNVAMQLTTIPADSLSTSKIFFSLPVEVDTARLTVKVKTSGGIFLQSNSTTATVTLRYNTDSLKNIGELTLKSNSIPALVDVQIDYETIVIHKQINFTRAYPEDIVLTANSISIKPTNNSDGEITMTIKLMRNIGVPSQKTPVTFDVYDSTYSRKLGIFKVKTQSTDLNGLAQSVFVLGDSLVNNVVYLGILNVIGTTKNENGEILADTIKLFSVK